jgi:hypothetical protein
MSYTPLWEIIQFAQKGSGYTRSKDTTQSKQVVDSLSQKGWSKSYLKKNLYNLDDDLLSGWPDELFQESYMKETATVDGSLFTSLVKLGIKSNQARETVRIVAPLEDSYYTDKQLLDFAIEYILGNYAPIAAPNVSYFFHPDSLNTWIPFKKKEIMNVSYSCTNTIVPTFRQHIQSMFPSSRGNVFFHTTNWRGAQDIMNVISLIKGRICLDFGLDRAFYLSESVKDAIDWGVKHSGAWSNEVAILIFYIPYDFYKDFSYKDLTINHDEWNWVVTSFRNCKELDDVKEYDEQYDFIYGPMMKNPKKYKIEGPKTHQPPIMQLAAKNVLATRYLYKYMKGACVFKKHATR